MTSPQFLSILFSLTLPLITLTQAHPYNYAPATTKPKPTSPKIPTNQIDSCWRADPNWASSRRRLADCAVGFGRAAIGGKYGATYIVTSSADDAVDPKPGTLRYGAIQSEPLWIIFGKDMVIELESELMVNSYKTIDGRGADVAIANRPCVTVQGVSHVIIHGVAVRDCKPGKPGLVWSSPVHVGHRLGPDGDAMTVMSSSHVWIDHCFLARAGDGLVDVTHASTAVTVSNNYFTQHDKVMLLGHNDQFKEDKVMKVTVAFNRFGTSLIERMPRFGYAHVANNCYDEWKMYAIGGSAAPTILSEGNYFVASDNSYDKQVTKRETSGSWKSWKWRSLRDVFLNGAYFVYTKVQSFKISDGSMVPALTAQAGPLHCVAG